MDSRAEDAAVDLLLLLHTCGAPPRFTVGHSARKPFDAYQDLPCSQAARIHFTRDGELARGIMLLAFANAGASEKAFRRILKGECLQRERAGEPEIIRKFFNAHEDLRSRIPVDLQDDEEDEGSGVPFEGKPFSYVALARSGDLLISMAAAGCSSDEQAGLDAYLQRVIAAVRGASADPQYLERQLCQTRERLRVRVAQALGRELQILGTKMQQKIRRDDYGNEDYSASLQEVAYFTERVVLPRLDLTSLEREILTSVITDLAGAVADDAGFSRVSGGPRAEGLSFELECADSLRRCGWETRVTKASGDQGVDVIATIGDLKVTLQCKFSSAPVGNKAVQEALAGKAFERAAFAAVVTNSTYTQAAKQLAAMSGVMLLHHRDLPLLAARCGLVGHSEPFSA